MQLAAGKDVALREITMAEIPEMVYNSNAIENSTLTLRETADILLRDEIKKDHSIREIYEAKNHTAANLGAPEWHTRQCGAQPR